MHKDNVLLPWFWWNYWIVLNELTRVTTDVSRCFIDVNLTWIFLSSLIKQAEAHVLIRLLGLLLGCLLFGRRSCWFHLHNRSGRSSNSESAGISQEGLHLRRETMLHVRHAFSSNKGRKTSIRAVWDQASETLSVGMNSTDMDGWTEVTLCRTDQQNWTDQPCCNLTCSTSVRDLSFTFSAKGKE